MFLDSCEPSSIADSGKSDKVFEHSHTHTPTAHLCFFIYLSIFLGLGAGTGFGSTLGSGTGPTNESNRAEKTREIHETKVPSDDGWIHGTFVYLPT